MKKSKTEALTKLEEAAAISTNLTSLGTHRDAVMLHALNGLANTKALYAAGERLSHEVCVIVCVRDNVCVCVCDSECDSV